MSKRFDCIRIYKNIDNKEQGYGNIEFVLPKKSRLKETFILSMYKRCKCSRLNDGRLVFCPKTYDEFIECLEDTKFSISDDEFISYQILFQNPSQDNNYIKRPCNFVNVIDFAKKDLSDSNWDRLHKEYLTRSFNRRCNAVLNQKRIKYTLDSNDEIINR